MLRCTVHRCGFSGAKTGLKALVDRCLVRLVDSEGETQREITKGHAAGHVRPHDNTPTLPDALHAVQA